MSNQQMEQIQKIQTIEAQFKDDQGNPITFGDNHVVLTDGSNYERNFNIVMGGMEQIKITPEGEIFVRGEKVLDNAVVGKALTDLLSQGIMPTLQVVNQQMTKSVYSWCDQFGIPRKQAASLLSELLLELENINLKHIQGDFLYGSTDTQGISESIRDGTG